ncbi:MAG: glycosyltransferase family 2 protein [Anaerolineae bacterium]
MSGYREQQLSDLSSERSNVQTLSHSDGRHSDGQRSNDLSVIIVNWNTRDLLADCLRSVYDTVHDLTLEVFVVDNASSDGSAAMVREQFSDVRLIENTENVGFARANNQAIAQATGRYVLLLNSDTVLLPDAVRTLVAELDADAARCAVGPRLLNADGSTQPSCHPVLTPWREFWRLCFLDRLVPLAHYPFELDTDGDPREVQVLKGACILLRREALVQVGAFDERYFMYSEEMDLFLRLLRAGWTTYWVPAARVIHLGGRSTAQVADPMYLELYRSKAQFQDKFYGAAGVLAFRVLVTLAYLPRYAWAMLAGPRDRARLYGRLLLALPGL